MRLFKTARLVFLASSIAALTAYAVSEQSVTPASPKMPAPSATADPYLALRMELAQLKSTVIAHGQQIAIQKAVLDAYAQKKEGNNTAVLAAIGVVIAAAIGGMFALRNQNKQADQERLLKAVELIMESRSGYQADIRRKNLSVFLNDETRRHLDGIREEFSGPEFTDLHLGLAQAMSEKAATPQEVLEIWKCVLKDKKVFGKIDYSIGSRQKTT